MDKVKKTRENENEYQGMLSRELFDKTPKAVFAALFVSYPYNCGVTDLNKYLLEEWALLHTQGIVPQKPPKFNTGTGKN